MSPWRSSESLQFRTSILMDDDVSELNLYQTILLAAQERRLVKLAYWPPGKPLSVRVVACHHLSQIGDDGPEFLHAWQMASPGHPSGWRTFRLDRINHITLMDETFTPREPITIRDDDDALPLDYFELKARLGKNGKPRQPP